VARATLNLKLEPRFRSVGEVVAGHEDGEAPDGMDERLRSLKWQLETEAGCTPDEMRFFFETDHHPTIMITNLLRKHKFTDMPAYDIMKRYVQNTFSSSQLQCVSPHGLSPVILGTTWLYMRGRNMSKDAYKAIMGFPADYVFPKVGRKNYSKDMRTYLSKGVIPQVAAWVYGQVLTQLGVSHPEGCDCQGCSPDEVSYHVDCPPNRIADLRFQRTQWGAARSGDLPMPPLRAQFENQDWSEVDGTPAEQEPADA
jgi:hypothetical protein